jgi:hypothetical protein
MIDKQNHYPPSIERLSDKQEAEMAETQEVGRQGFIRSTATGDGADPKQRQCPETQSQLHESDRVGRSGAICG